jgi:hypothetical protein
MQVTSGDVKNVYPEYSLSRLFSGGQSDANDKEFLQQVNLTEQPTKDPPMSSKESSHSVPPTSNGTPGSDTSISSSQAASPKLPSIVYGFSPSNISVSYNRSNAVRPVGRESLVKTAVQRGNVSTLFLPLSDDGGRKEFEFECAIDDDDDDDDEALGDSRTEDGQWGDSARDLEFRRSLLTMMRREMPQGLRKYVMLEHKKNQFVRVENNALVNSPCNYDDDGRTHGV